MTRHTWQSWRERYKKNAARLDVKISEIVERNKPNKGEKGQYGYVRKSEEKVRRPKKKSIDCTVEVEGEPVAGPSTAQLDFMADSVLLPLPMQMSGMPPLGPVQTTFPLSAASYPTSAPLMSAGSGPSTAPFPSLPEVLAARRDASEEEDDESEWQIREGHGPQPAWAKRKARVEEEDGVQGNGPTKRLKSDQT